MGMLLKLCGAAVMAPVPVCGGLAQSVFTIVYELRESFIVDNYREYFTYPLQHLKVYPCVPVHNDLYEPCPAQLARQHEHCMRSEIMARVFSADLPHHHVCCTAQDLKRIKKQKMKDIIKAMEAFNENLVGGKRLVKVNAKCDAAVAVALLLCFSLL